MLTSTNGENQGIDSLQNESKAHFKELGIQVEGMSSPIAQPPLAPGRQGMSRGGKNIQEEKPPYAIKPQNRLLPGNRHRERQLVLLQRYTSPKQRRFTNKNQAARQRHIGEGFQTISSTMLSPPRLLFGTLFNHSAMNKPQPASTIAITITQRMETRPNILP